MNRLIKSINRHRILLVIIIGTLLWLLYSFFYISPVLASDIISPQEKTEMVMVPRSDLNKLKNLMKQQDEKLALLENTLTEPQKQTLILYNELNEAKNSLNKSTMELAEVKTSLENAETLITKQQQSLMECSKEIKKLQSKRKRDKFQFFLLGAVGSYLVYKF